MEKGEFMKDCKRKKSVSELFPGDLVVRIPGFLFIALAQVQSLLRELRSHKLHSIRITNILGTRE